MHRRRIEADPLFPFGDFRTNAASFALLERYWPAVFAEALGPEEAARVVSPGAADRDTAGFGTPVLCRFRLPRRGRGVRVLFNDAPEAGTERRGHSRPFLSAGRENRPGGWPCRLPRPRPRPCPRPRPLPHPVDPRPRHRQSPAASTQGIARWTPCRTSARTTTAPSASRCSKTPRPGR